MRGSKGGFADLKRLREQALAQRRQEEAAAQAAARAMTRHENTARGTARLPERGTGPQDGSDPAAEDPRADLRAFRQAMRAVTPLPSGNRVVHAHRADAGAIAAQRRASALGETARRADAGVSDGDVTHLLSEGGTAFVRADAAPDSARRLRRGQWPAGAELDLHGLRVEQARHAALSFIDECLEHGIRCVRIVHGKGYGSEGLTPVLKDKVRTWLVQKPQVMAFSEAPEREGGAGALLVLLRQGEETRR